MKIKSMDLHFEDGHSETVCKDDTKWLLICVKSGSYKEKLFLYHGDNPPLEIPEESAHDKKFLSMLLEILGADKSELVWRTCNDWCYLLSDNEKRFIKDNMDKPISIYPSEHGYDFFIVSELKLHYNVQQKIIEVYTQEI